ncbi:hypothetical protein [Maribacter polysaccharolyticus]|uniref:hypothetical protein n=1 Tax=Maribacter polysaccharolyticus TaxID=3020831 RepID=UPI00237EF308|nr:hypothetical protein [Maribacter polysaccharolyticus]MDE3744047.1 hypothetical protein [Maribacter polysaccharolyticus]
MSKAENIIRQINGDNNTAPKTSFKVVPADDKPFNELRLELAGKNYSKVSVAYVDEDVHGAFKHIKDHFGLNVGDLFSYLGERWLLENQEDIKSLTKKNKFI